MSRLSYLMALFAAAYIGAAVAAFAKAGFIADQQQPALCETDSECAELCPEGTRDLPADDPEYCDGGPDDGSATWQQREQERLCGFDVAHCEGPQS